MPEINIQQAWRGYNQVYLTGNGDKNVNKSNGIGQKGQKGWNNILPTASEENKRRNENIPSMSKATVAITADTLHT